MNIIEQLRKDKIESYKDKDMIKNGVVSLLLSAMILKEKETKVELSSEDTIAILQRELKQTKETLSLTPEDRIDSISESKKKIEIIESYLPKQLGVEEVKTFVSDYLKNKDMVLDNKSRGVVMKEVLTALQGQTDGKTLNIVITELLKG